MKWTGEELQSILRYVDQYRKSHPNSSYSDALRAFRDALAEKMNVHHRNSELPSLKTLQNVLSQARHTFPEKSQ